MAKPGLKDQLARALADYDNLTKRIEREKYELEFKSNLRLILRLLPVVDSLRQALAHLKDPGLAITLTELENILKDEGVEEIKIKKGDLFDPETCEAIEVVAKTGQGNKIEEILLPGWRFVDGPVLRHVKVKVCQK